MTLTSKNNVLNGLLVAGALAGFCAVSNNAAEARGSGAMGVATASRGADRGCFNDERGGMRNDCAATKQVTLSTVSDNAGTAHFQIRARGVNGTARRVSCRAYSVDWRGQNLKWGGYVATVQHTGATENLRSTVGSHGWGATYAYCWLAQGTLIRNYHY